MVEIILQKLSTVNGIVASIIILALVIGIVLGSPVGRIMCGVLLVAVLAYAFVRRQRPEMSWWGSKPKPEEDVYSHSPEGDMKKATLR